MMSVTVLCMNRLFGHLLGNEKSDAYFIVSLGQRILSDYINVIRKSAFPKNHEVAQQ